jgi:hypothetical protein
MSVCVCVCVCVCVFYWELNQDFAHARQALFYTPAPGVNLTNLIPYIIGLHLYKIIKF